MSQSVLTVRTTAGFGIDTTASGGDAFMVTGYDGFTLTDNNSSSITGRDHGIYAFTKGNGALSITTSGVVTGIESHGIFASSLGNCNLDTTIKTAAVTGGATGIAIDSSGIGGMSITSSGAVTGIRSDGIRASNSGSGAAGLTIQTMAVAGGWDGIHADNNSGALTLTSRGTVTGAGSDGIFATNSGTDLTLQTLTVVGSKSGIRASNYRGTLAIVASGAVTGTEKYGIHAFNSSFGTALTVQTAVVTGGRRGIEAWNFGSGALSIKNSDSVTSTAGDGISAVNSGTDLIISTSFVRGDEDGIDVFNRGSGVLSITTSGDISGSKRDGISAVNYGSDLKLSTMAVTGRNRGIYARNDGSGALSITSSGEVTGLSGGTSWSYGIRALNSSNGTGLTLQTAGVTGYYCGIAALNDGSGALSITSSGTVTGETGIGIVASNTNGTDLIIQTAAVTGWKRAISASNTGSGTLNITSSQAVTGGLYGIVARSFGSGELSITNSQDVSGGFKGITARSYGSGALSVTSSGRVTGNYQAGIYAAGAGEIRIRSSDAVTSTFGNGIVSRNYGTDLFLHTETVSGGYVGISIFQNGEGALTIMTDGVVSGDSSHALRLDRYIAGTTTGTITNNGGLVSNQSAAVLMTSGLNFEGDFNNHADITGGNGTAFDASATTNGIVINQFAGTIADDVLLGSGDDRVNITGGSINGRIIGQGFGTVTIDVGAGNTFAGNGLVDVAEYVIQSGTVHQMADFSAAAATTTIARGATLSFDSRISGGGALVSNGDLEFVLSPNAAGELMQQGTVALNGGSTISVNTNGLNPILNQSFQLISASSIIDNGVVLTEDAFGSLLYDFEAVIDSASVSVVTSVADLGTVSPLQNPSAFGDSMTAFVSGGGDNAVVELLARLDSGDVQGFEQVADVFSPSISGAVSQGAREANDSTWRLINERFVGSSAPFPDSEPPNGLWLQGYGGTSDQDAIDDVEGFDADTSGVAVGYDLDLNQWRVGAAFSAGETNIDNDRFASDRIDIESNQLIVYGGFRQDQWFANATASAAALDYDFKRNNLVAGEGPIESDTDGDLLGMSVGGGYQYTMSDHIVLAPQLSLRYTTLDVDDYTEDGGLDLRVEYDDLDTLASELGVSASARYGAGDWQLGPTARLAWVHEYLDENEKATAWYAGQSYIQEGFEPDQDFASVGLGMQASNEYGVSISLDYRGAFGSNFSSNQGWLSARYEF
ncbi:MAG: autotransporter domain-containing protein [Haliea sp.]|nr:autotransporter domain-containing protein [Haliea sp.]